MDIFSKFKQELLENSNTTSKLTIKNYLSDVRKFAIWYMEKYNRPFPPSVLTQNTVSEFIQIISESSPRSAKRYTSSLRKFFESLSNQGLITYNPLAIQKVPAISQDLWHLRDFKNYLYNLKKNPVTIKNYLSDINQFTSWFEKIELNHGSVGSIGDQVNPFAKITLEIVEEFKSRLISEANISPISINRKLSSIRQYFIWAINYKHFPLDQDLINEIPNIRNEILDQNLIDEPSKVKKVHSIEELRTDPDIYADEDPIKNKQNYSAFPPIRFLQKTGKAIGVIFDAVFVLSIIKGIENFKFKLWKATGKEIFAPIPEVMKSIQSGLDQRSLPIDPLKVNTNFKQALTSLDRFVKIKDKENITRIHGLPKSFYAPNKISTRPLPVWKKIFHHLKYSRPKWYKKYHTYPIAHYLHFGIAIIIAVILGLRIYQPFINTNIDTSVLSTQIEPNREISFKGNLSDIDGLPITNERNIRFAIYNSKIASGSALLWEETDKVKPDPAGNFSVILGRLKPIKQKIFAENSALYLGISIGTSPELKPREILANYMQSSNSETLQGLRPITGNNAGTENVILALDSSGNLTIGNNSNPIFQATGGNFSLKGNQVILASNLGSNGNIILNPDGTGIIDLQKPIQNTSEDPINGSGSNAVRIDDNLEINPPSNSKSALQINQNGFGDLISARRGDSAKFTVSNSGTVTIAEDLIILGNNISTLTDTFRIADTKTSQIFLGGKANEIFLGGSEGTTNINHNLKVNNQITAQNGLVLPFMSNGSIPFINEENRLSQDSKNFFWDNISKRLGIGTGSPKNRLSVVDNVSLSGSSVVAITNTSALDSVDNVALRLNLGVVTPGSQARFITFYSNCDNSSCGGVAKGNIAITASGVSYNSGSADFAEYFKKSNPNESFEKGDLVCYSRQEGVEKCNKQSSGVLGVISDNAAFVGNSSFENNSSYVLVGLVGQLEAKVSKNTINIKPGDPIGINYEDGNAQKSMLPGQIVGRALESFDSNLSNKNLVKILLNVSWFDPEAMLLDNGNLATAYETIQLTENSISSNQSNKSFNIADNTIDSINNFLDTLKNGALKVTQLSVESLSIGTENITIGTLTLKAYITGIVNDILDERISEDKKTNETRIVLINPLADPNSEASKKKPLESEPQKNQNQSIEATSEAELTPNPSPKETNITNITNIYNNISSQSAQVATNSAIIASNDNNISESSISAEQNPPEVINLASDILKTQNSDEATPDVFKAKDNIRSLGAFDISNLSGLSNIPNLNTGFGKFEYGLIALGPTSLTDATISTQITIGGNLKISNNAIDSIGSDLNLQPLRQGNLNFMAGLVTIDTQGNLNVEGNANFAQDVNVRGRLAAGIISPINESDLVIQLGNNRLDGQKTTNESTLVINDSTGSKVISIDQKGNIKASGSATFTNFKLIRGAQADTSLTETVASGSAGTAIITANEPERTIISPFVTADSLIYITPLSDTKGQSPYIARQTAEDSQKGIKGSFTIQIPKIQPFDIKMNWIIIN